MKLRMLCLVMIMLVLSVGSVFAADLEHGKLNEIKVQPSTANFSFKSDVMGLGADQTIKISKDTAGKYSIAVVESNTILSSINFMSVSKYQGMFFKESWFLAYLRNDTTPSLIYFVLDGSGQFINDLKIFGLNNENEFVKIFDIISGTPPVNDSEMIAEIAGDHHQLLLIDTLLIVTGSKGQVVIELDENNLPGCPLPVSE